MAATAPPFFNAQFLTDGGVVAAGYLLYAFASGTSTPQDTYTSQAGSTAASHPITLDSAGRCALWLHATLEYSFELRTAADVLVERWDDVLGIPIASATQFVPLAGAVTMTGRFNLAGSAQSSLQPVPLTQAQSLIATALASATAITANAQAATTTAGTSTAYTLTPSNALAAYATGSTRAVIFHTASGAAPTMNISGLGAKSLKQFENDAKVAARVPSGFAADVTYDGTDLIVGPAQGGYGTIGSATSYTFPGGFIVKLGTTGSLSQDSSGNTVTFPAAFPTTCVGALAVPLTDTAPIVGSNHSWCVHTPVASSFKINNDGVASPFFWVAFGN